MVNARLVEEGYARAVTFPPDEQRPMRSASATWNAPRATPA